MGLSFLLRKTAPSDRPFAEKPHFPRTIFSLTQDAPCGIIIAEIIHLISEVDRDEDT